MSIFLDDTTSNNLSISAAAQKTGDQKLSFAWIAYDILNTVRQKNMFASDDIPVPRPPQFKVMFLKIALVRTGFIAFKKTPKFQII